MVRKMAFTIMLLSVFLALVPAVAAQTGGYGCGGTLYTVQTGDTLASISRQFGVGVDQIAAINGIYNPNYIQIASVLCIPGAGSPPPSAPPPHTPPSHPAPAPSCSGNYYTVRHGDTLSGISRNYGVSVYDLVAVNGIADANRVFAGTQLCIPSGGGYHDGGTGYYGGSTSGAVDVNGGQFVIELAPNTPTVVPAGSYDPHSGATTTASISLDAMNNVFYVNAPGHIPNSYVRVYVSAALGDLGGGIIARLPTDAQGVATGYVQIPFLYPAEHQYVMIRSYDRRMTFGFFDLRMPRFP